MSERDPFLAVFNQHVNDAARRTQRLMRKHRPEWLRRVRQIEKEDDGIMAIFHREPEPATLCYVWCVTDFVNGTFVTAPAHPRAAKEKP